jgi:translation initiation factor IF-2
LSQIPNTKISDVYDVLCGQFAAGDRGKKEASKEVGEEKRRRSFTCRERKRVEDKRKQERKSKQQQEVIKARAVM